MKKIKEILIYIWILPQNIIGLIYLFWNKYIWKDINKITKENNINYYYVPKSPGSVSLGKYIFTCNKIQTTKKHETGHYRQGLYLGPLYLIVIGLPSIIWAGIIHKHTTKSYYWFYTESWADKLGGVKRRNK